MRNLIALPSGLSRAVFVTLPIVIALRAEPADAANRGDRVAVEARIDGHLTWQARTHAAARTASRSDDLASGSSLAEAKGKDHHEENGLTRASEGRSHADARTAPRSDHHLASGSSLAEGKVKDDHEDFGQDGRDDLANPRTAEEKVWMKEHKIDCDSPKDMMQFLAAERRYKEGFMWIGGFTSFIVTVTIVGFWFGLRVKPRPPRYWKHRPWNIFRDDFDEEVDVTQELRESVQGLMDQTTIREAMGVGRDGSWATHKAFKVVKVTRIENGEMWSKYTTVKNHMVVTSKLVKEMPKNMAEATLKAVDAINEVHSKRDEDPQVAIFLRSLGLDAGKNEKILFHGSPAAGARHASGSVLFESDQEAPIHAIKKMGFDDRLGSVKGMYGSGTYFADMASKADQYAGRYNEPGGPQGSVGEVAHMFLSRVCLGAPYLTNQSLEQLRRPPCTHNHFDLNLRWNEEATMGTPWRKKGVEFKICDHERFDSVMGDFMIDGKKKLYREFMIYEQQAYPEFCVTYERLA